MLAHMNENIINSRCWACCLLPMSRNVTIALFSYVFTKITNLLCQKIYEQGITYNPTITPSIAFLPHRLKDRMCPFNPQKDLPSSWDFPGNKTPLWKSTCLCKNTSNFHLPQISLLYSIQQLYQQSLQSSLSGWKLSRLMQSLCLLHSLAQSVLPISQTPAEKSWNNLEHNGQNRKKSPFSILFWALVRE